MSIGDGISVDVPPQPGRQNLRKPALVGTFAENSDDSQEDEDDGEVERGDSKEARRPAATRRAEISRTLPASTKRKTRFPPPRSPSHIFLPEPPASPEPAQDEKALATFWEYHVMRSTWQGDDDTLTPRVSCGRYYTVAEANEAAKREAFGQGEDDLLGGFDEYNIARDQSTSMLTIHGESRKHGNILVFVDRILATDAPRPPPPEVTSRWLPETAYTIWETRTHASGSSSPDTTSSLPEVHVVRESANRAAYDLVRRIVARQNPAGKLSVAEQIEHVEVITALTKCVDAADEEGRLFEVNLEMSSPVVGVYDLRVWVVEVPIKGPRN
ncbi:MAG: hypothetical protein M1832_002677 [Thelocarpon impressellum]|nr:MAG: hypothetical protein M1832_002677 [Thelocarpon impressellum]